jgi:hypothetical protein
MQLASVEAPIHLGTVQGLIDRLDNLIRSREYVIVPEAQYAKPSRSQEVIAPGVISLPLDMLASIEFDND